MSNVNGGASGAGDAASTGPGAAWLAVHERLTDEIDPLVDAVVARFRSELPGYGVRTTAELRGGTKRNVQYVLATVAERRPPLETELADAEAIGAVRARQGIPTDELVRGFRIAVQEIWSREQSYARDEGLSDAVLLEAAQRMWEWADILMTRAARVHRQVELEAVRHDHETKISLLQGILFGSIGPNDLRLKASAYGLDPNQLYVPFRARVTDSITMAELEHNLVATTARAGAHDALAGLFDHDLAGLVPSRPPASMHAVIGIGPLSHLDRMEQPFRSASTALETASAFQLSGTFDTNDLGIRTQIYHASEFGDEMVMRYLHPLTCDQVSRGELDKTLRAFFTHGMHIDETAKSLFVHPNTLRRRLRKIEHLSGVNMHQMEDLVQIWWALQRATLSELSSDDKR
jgi:hypothetical protein